MEQALGMQNLDDQSKMQVLQVANQIVDKALEDEMEKLDNILNDEDELAKLRRQRLAEMKEAQSKKSKWKNMGHGSLQELDEKTFLTSCQESERVVAVFTTPNNEFGATLLDHMRVLAAKHPETRFVSLNAEKSPFVVDRLKIWMIPSTVLVKDEKTFHTLLGLQEIAPSGKYETWHVENVLYQYEMVTHQAFEEAQRRDDLDNDDEE